MVPGQAQQQLALEIRLRDDATFDNFFTTSPNEVVVNALSHWDAPSSEPVMYLHGAEGSGKTHLLQASCHQFDADALYLPLGELSHFQPQDVLQGVESMALLCLDDLQRVSGVSEWEEALFNLYNRARQSGCRLLLAADTAPRKLPVSLPDLASRLSWGVVYQLAEANDEEKAQILRFRAGRRGMTLSPEAAAYIVHRAPRETGDLLQLLDKLDQASLVEQRALSIPFVKTALGL